MEVKEEGIFAVKLLQAKFLHLQNQYMKRKRVEREENIMQINHIELKLLHAVQYTLLKTDILHVSGIKR